MPLWQTCRAPSVSFRTNNRISSTLFGPDLRSLFDIFSRNTRVLLVPSGDPARGKAYPIRALMKQTSTDFYKWYATESEPTTRISLLAFEVLDIRRNEKQSFVIEAGNLLYFQSLKQNIWDSFWSSLYLNGVPPSIQISVSHLLENVVDCSTRVTMICAAQGGYSTIMDAELGQEVGCNSLIINPRKQSGKDQIYIIFLIRLLCSEICIMMPELKKTSKTLRLLDNCRGASLRLPQILKPLATA